MTGVGGRSQRTPDAGRREQQPAPSLLAGGSGVFVQPESGSGGRVHPHPFAGGSGYGHVSHGRRKAGGVVGGAGCGGHVGLRGGGVEELEH